MVQYTLGSSEWSPDMASSVDAGAALCWDAGTDIREDDP